MMPEVKSSIRAVLRALAYRSSLNAARAVVLTKSIPERWEVDTIADAALELVVRAIDNGERPDGVSIMQMVRR